MHQVSRTVDSITLSWSQPDQPNGVILDYELQYYEKVHTVIKSCTNVSSKPSFILMNSFCFLQSGPNNVIIPFFIAQFNLEFPHARLHSSRSLKACSFWILLRTSVHSRPITIMVSHCEAKPHSALKKGHWGLMCRDLWLKLWCADWCKNSVLGPSSLKSAYFLTRTLTVKKKTVFIQQHWRLKNANI